MDEWYQQIKDELCEDSKNEINVENEIKMENNDNCNKIEQKVENDSNNVEEINNDENNDNEEINIANKKLLD